MTKDKIVQKKTESNDRTPRTERRVRLKTQVNSHYSPPIFFWTNNLTDFYSATPPKTPLSESRVITVVLNPVVSFSVLILLDLLPLIETLPYRLLRSPDFPPNSVLHPLGVLCCLLFFAMICSCWSYRICFRGLQDSLL